jgi:hypothetical protein
VVIFPEECEDCNGHWNSDEREGWGTPSIYGE